MINLTTILVRCFATRDKAWSDATNGGSKNARGRPLRNTAYLEPLNLPEDGSRISDSKGVKCIRLTLEMSDGHEPPVTLQLRLT